MIRFPMQPSSKVLALGWDSVMNALKMYNSYRSFSIIHLKLGSVIKSQCSLTPFRVAFMFLGFFFMKYKPLLPRIHHHFTFFDNIFKMTHVTAYYISSGLDQVLFGSRPSSSTTWNTSLPNQSVTVSSWVPISPPDSPNMNYLHSVYVCVWWVEGRNEWCVKYWYMSEQWSHQFNRLCVCACVHMCECDFVFICRIWDEEWREVISRVRSKLCVHVFVYKFVCMCSMTWEVVRSH